jgi:hypothetical protein
VLNRALIALQQTTGTVLDILLIEARSNPWVVIASLTSLMAISSRTRW